MKSIYSLMACIICMAMGSCAAEQQNSTIAKRDKECCCKGNCKCSPGNSMQGCGCVNSK